MQRYENLAGKIYIQIKGELPWYDKIIARSIASFFTLSDEDSVEQIGFPKDSTDIDSFLFYGRLEKDKFCLIYDNGKFYPDRLVAYLKTQIAHIEQKAIRFYNFYIGESNDFITAKEFQEKYKSTLPENTTKAAVLPVVLIDPLFGYMGDFDIIVAQTPRGYIVYEYTAEGYKIGDLKSLDKNPVMAVRKFLKRLGETGKYPPAFYVTRLPQGIRPQYVVEPGQPKEYRIIIGGS